MSAPESEVRDSLGGLDAPTVHRYPTDARYRKSQDPLPQPGDVAFCGYVKQRPGGFRPGGGATCLMCLRLEGLLR